MHAARWRVLAVPLPGPPRGAHLGLAGRPICPGRCRGGPASGPPRRTPEPARAAVGRLRTVSAPRRQAARLIVAAGDGRHTAACARTLARSGNIGSGPLRRGCRGEAAPPLRHRCRCAVVQALRGGKGLLGAGRPAQDQLPSESEGLLGPPKSEQLALAYSPYCQGLCAQERAAAERLPLPQVLLATDPPTMRSRRRSARLHPALFITFKTIYI
jgi:hypothetical protein